MRTHNRAFAAWIGTWTGSFIASAALLGCLASGARAALLLPGGSAPTTGGGTYGVAKVYDSGPVPFVSLGSVFHGLLDSQVWKEAGGTLDFVYQFSNDPNSGDVIDRFTVSDFEGFNTNADDTPAGGGSVFPVSMDRSSLGDVVGFQFSNVSPVLPGTTSYQMVIDTNAIAFNPTGGTASLIDGDVAFVAVPTPIPEPASGAVAAIALSALALRPRKTPRLR